MVSKSASSDKLRIAVKVGTSLIDSEEGDFNRETLVPIVESIARRMKAGQEVVLISSGAVGVGRRRLDWRDRPTSVIDRQALAAVGQPDLMRIYRELFSVHGIQVAQILLTRQGLENRKRYLNARHTIDRLLSLGILPIVNENDTVITEELQFGDNDRLAALVAGKIQSDLLILLTDVEAVLDDAGNPVKRVHEVSASLLGAAGGPASFRSRGGMKTKLIAVQEAMLMGATAVIGSGKVLGLIDAIVEAYPKVLGETEPIEAPGTWFLPHGAGLHGKKRWIRSFSTTRGTIVVDEGARQALELDGRSLLPSGVHKVKGVFAKGDPVGIASLENVVFAQGLANLSSSELKKFKGQSTRAIKEQIGRPIGSCVAVHRNDLVLMRNSRSSSL